MTCTFIVISFESVVSEFTAILKIKPLKCHLKQARRHSSSKTKNLSADPFHRSATRSFYWLFSAVLCLRLCFRLLGLDETSEDHDDDKVFKCYNVIADLCINIESYITPLLPDDNLDISNVSDASTSHHTGRSTSSSVRLTLVAFVVRHRCQVVAITFCQSWQIP